MEYVFAAGGRNSTSVLTRLARLRGKSCAHKHACVGFRPDLLAAEGAGRVEGGAGDGCEHEGGEERDPVRRRRDGREHRHRGPHPSRPTGGAARRGDEAAL